jgi:hypothetical protein
MKGGQFVITLSQAPDSNLYLWAKKATELKKGSVLFQPDLGITVLEILFINGYCVSLARNTDETSGTQTMAVSPEEVHADGIEHNNFWPS